MPQKRKDADYLRQRIADLYRNYTAKEIAALLNTDPNVTAGPVTERAVYNVLNKLRQQHQGETETAAVVYKDKPWTDDEDATLRQSYNSGASIPEIAQRMSRTVPSIHSRIQKLQLSNRTITPEQVQAVRDMIQSTTKSLKEIAYEMGVKYSAVRHVSDQLKKELGVTGRHHSDISFLEDGSLAERLIRAALIGTYGDAIVPWPHNRDWSQGRGWQIDIPIELPSGLKIAVEVNHYRTHADRRNRDYAKRQLAEQLGWIWLPVWFEDELTQQMLSDTVNRICQIIETMEHGSHALYYDYISAVEELEKRYYSPTQPPYDPKESVTFGEPWSDADTDLVQSHYGKMPIEQLQAILSAHRTVDAIKHKARSLCMTRTRKNFSDEEDEIIRQLYAKTPPEYLQEMLPGRSWTSIASRAIRLGVKRRAEWSQEEDAILRAVYPEESRLVIESKLPERSWSAIVSRASRLGVRRTAPFSPTIDCGQTNEFQPTT